MLRFAPLALLLFAGCTQTEPAVVSDDPDAVIEQTATEAPDRTIYGNLPSADPDCEACYMDGLLVPAASVSRLDWNGQIYSFCCAGCRDAFVRNPAHFVLEARHQLTFTPEGKPSSEPK